MRRPSWPVAGPLGSVVATLALGVALTTLPAARAPGTAETLAAAAGSAPAVRSVLGPGIVSSPGGIALDTSGDLFVADTGHCRVLVVPAKTGRRYGIHLRSGRVATVSGGRCTASGGIGAPTGVAVDNQGDLYVAEATAQRVQELRPSGRAMVTVAGTGRAGFTDDGLMADASQLDQPTSVAVDAAGDLYIADTANCRVRVLAAGTTTLFGQAMEAGHLYTAAGTGVCGTTGQGGPARAAQLWNPVAVAVDPEGDLLVADRGDQSVLLASAHGGSFYGTTVGAGDIGVVVGGTGSYGPYLSDGLAATGPTAELNDPRGLALGPDGTLFVTDGFMHALRVAPSTNVIVFGRPMSGGHLYTAAGAVPVTSATGAGNGTKWVVARLGTPVGVGVSASGTVYVADAGTNTVRAIAAADT